MKSITFALAGVLLAAVAGTAVAAELPDLKGRTIEAVTEKWARLGLPGAGTPVD